MEYSEAVAYIHSLLKFGMKPGLERMEALLKELGNPEQRLQFIHVAGTNGKGSTCNMLSRILMASGYKTGLFTSPYVVDFCERIQVNHLMIPKEDLSRQVERIQPVLERLAKDGIQPTEFEVITAIAFNYFAKSQCDVVVLEVGLGGRLDSTNVIDFPLASVITAVSFDHMSVLGNTLAQIAAEKCGIIKEEGVTVAYPYQQAEAQQVIQDTCKEKKNALLLPNPEWVTQVSYSLEGTRFSYRGQSYLLPLLGRHQVWNAVTVIETAKALQHMGLHITDQAMFEGIKAAVVPARMEVLSTDPFVLLDGGHNEDCALALDHVLHTYLPQKKLIGLMGMMEDKEYDRYLSIIAPHFSTLFCVAPQNPRALSAERLAGASSRYCNDTVAYTTVEAAVQAAQKALDKADALVICGSFYLASELRSYFKK